MKKDNKGKNIELTGIINSKKLKILLIAIIIILILLGVTILKNKNTQKLQEQKQAETEAELINLDIEIKEETDESYKCLLTFVSSDENNKIKSIEYPAEEGTQPQIIQIADEGKQKIFVDYEFIKDDENKIFKVTTIRRK